MHIDDRAVFAAAAAARLIYNSLIIDGSVQQSTAAAAAAACGVEYQLFTSAAAGTQVTAFDQAQDEVSRVVKCTGLMPTDLLFRKQHLLSPSRFEMLVF